MSAELEDFHPSDGHRHSCDDRTTCGCAADLYLLALHIELDADIADAQSHLNRLVAAQHECPDSYLPHLNERILIGQDRVRRLREFRRRAVPVPEEENQP